MSEHPYSEVVALVAALSSLKIRTTRTGKQHAFFDIPTTNSLPAPGMKLVTAALEPYGMEPHENAFALGPSFLVETATGYLFKNAHVDGNVRLHTPISFDLARYQVNLNGTEDVRSAFSLARDLAALGHGPAQLWFSYPADEADETPSVTLDFHTFREADMRTLLDAVKVVRRTRSRIHFHCIIAKEDHLG